MSNQETQRFGKLLSISDPYVILGPWRGINSQDVVNPEHISEINGIPSIPVRIYGHKPQPLESAQKSNPNIKNINGTNKILPT